VSNKTETKNNTEAWRKKLCKKNGSDICYNMEIFPPHTENTGRLINDTNTSNLKSSLSKQRGKKPPTYKNTIKLCEKSLIKESKQL